MPRGLEERSAIDFNQIPFIQAVMEQSSTHPTVETGDSGPLVIGRFYYNTTFNCAYIYTPTGWTSLGGTSDVLRFSLTTTSTASQVLVSLPANANRSVEYLVQGIDSVGNRFHSSKILAIHNGTSTDYTEYGTVQLGGLVGTYSVDYNGGNIRLMVTPANSNSTLFKVACISNPV